MKKTFYEWALITNSKSSFLTESLIGEGVSDLISDWQEERMHYTISLRRSILNWPR